MALKLVKSPPERHELSGPRWFGNYMLVECLGSGGTAVVYKAKRRGASGFEKTVAVKTIPPELGCKTRFVKLFQTEAQLSAELLHANIAQVHDFGFVGPTPYLEMEYLQGLTLRDVWERLAEKNMRMPVPVTLAIVTEACRGLAYAHAFVDDGGRHKPIIHSDVTPANVMLCRDGAVKLLDFGVARATRGETLAIETFQGKLAYMSPEQLERKILDRRADVFALGATLHELLTGERLFSGSDDRETLQRVFNHTPTLPSSLNREVVPALDALVMRALARDPDTRYQSAGEMLGALEALSARAAMRKELLQWLAFMAPELYTRFCDDCGRALPWGAECFDCRTQLGDDNTPAPPPLRHAPWAAPWEAVRGFVTKLFRR
jgi:serine/threonine-protein kinase